MTQLALIKNTKVALVKDGDIKVSGRGYRSLLVLEHLEDHLVTVSDKWCSMECLARTMLGRNCENNRKAIRQKLTLAFRYLLERNVFLVIDYYSYTDGHHGEAKAVKIYERHSEPTAEKQAAEVQLKRMLRRKEINSDRYDKAAAFLA